MDNQRGEVISWLAGILDADGCFKMKITRRVSGKVYRYPEICLLMKDKDTVEKVAALFGRSFHISKRSQEGARAGHSLCYRTSIAGVPAAAIIRQIYPWLSARRRARIDEILALSTVVYE
jgi:hypothetical protein